MALSHQVREVFLRAGANLFSGFTFARMSPEQAARHVRIEGAEHLKAALAEGRGAIILLAHMGPWEALAHLPALVAREEIEAPFAALYRPLNNAYLDAWYRTQREAKGTRLFSRRDGFHKTADFLREGGVLGVLADQKTGRKAGVVVPFFGRRAKTNPLPGLLQRRAGVPMLALSLRTLSPGRWCLGLHPVDLPSGLPGERSREADASICNAALERVLAKSPLDGFWLHGRFSGKLP